MWQYCSTSIRNLKPFFWYGSTIKCWLGYTACLNYFEDKRRGKVNRSSSLIWCYIKCEWFHPSFKGSIHHLWNVRIDNVFVHSADVPLHEVTAVKASPTDVASVLEVSRVCIEMSPKVETIPKTFVANRTKVFTCFTNNTANNSCTWNNWSTPTSGDLFFPGSPHRETDRQILFCSGHQTKA